MAISEDSMLALSNVVARMESIYSMGSNMFLCEGAQTGSYAWVVFISYGDGKTPIAAFPKKYYDRMMEMPGRDREIYRAGLIKTFGLTPQTEKKLLPSPKGDGWFEYQDHLIYRLATHPGNEYGYNWNWLDEEFVQPHGDQLMGEEARKEVA